ncbi:MAG TPA: SpoIID/LytB domain-containing protein [Blastocatellia bacterium]|nr:SpoIID/LytB domain-containing protein [Blastocatellia bacterium]
MAVHNGEPSIKVGILTRVRDARFSLKGSFSTEARGLVPEGDYSCRLENGTIWVSGLERERDRAITFTPAEFDSCRVVIEDVTIGIDFHWQRKETQQFQGALTLFATDDGLTLINKLPLESYLVSVISSEMSASCPPDLQRAHAVVSRSWLLAQLHRRGEEKRPAGQSISESPAEQIRWYDRENHTDFDVCADDHCQRYQGISKAFSRSAFEAVRDTRGKALVFGDEVCDARYSKSCGGMTEIYSAAWEDKEVPYLVSIYDGAGKTPGYDMPLSVESNAERWIASSPPAYCDTTNRELLARVLPGFDQETTDFYRWQVSYTKDELREILEARLGHDFGRIISLDPLERGQSGRIVRLRIVGEKKSLVIGKELEIRRALSRSHLYSSAFVVRADCERGEGAPLTFHLLGAGWGHGVGLCQIGAAVMAERGRSHEEILAHYFRAADLRRLY